MLNINFTRIPEEPGVYRFYASSDNSEESLLYVGKAVNLKKRIKSYFQNSATLSPRISLMVKKITSLEYTVTENETSALILENNLIKTLKPKYNILFRDDKTYPSLRLTHHDFPKLESFRGKLNKGGDLFGPYPNVQSLKYNLDLIQRIFKLRTCSDVMFKTRTRPCMLHQIKRCTAPCVNYVTKNEYADQVRHALDFLSGKYTQIIEQLQNEMQHAANLMEFELAASLRDNIGAIKGIRANQIISSYNQPLNADIVTIKAHQNKAFVYLILLRQGMYVGDNHFVLKNPDNDLTEVLMVFLENYYLSHKKQHLFQVYTKHNLPPKYTAFLLQSLHLKITSKLTGQVDKLHTMGLTNLNKVIDNYSDGTKFILGCNKITEILQMPRRDVDNGDELPHQLALNRIECIDVSHNHGENTVASIVTCIEGEINSNHYRRYNLNEGLEGKKLNGDDIRAMQVVVTRRLTSTSLPMPDLFVIDGGKLQLDAVKNILKHHEMYGRIRIAAIFKGHGRDPMQDRVLFDNGVVLKVATEPEVFKLLHKLRDEAHRFAITAHRKRQVAKMSGSLLDEVPGVGNKIKKVLLLHFGSSKNIAQASVADLQQVNGIGEHLAQKIYSYFH